MIITINLKDIICFILIMIFIVGYLLILLIDKIKEFFKKRRNKNDI